MKIISNEKIVFFDVDQTLVDKCDNGELTLDYYGDIGTYKVFKKNSQQIKSHFKRGWTVFIWSHSGPEWAKQVVKALNLQSYVHFILNKPIKIFDDLPASEWMGERVYLKDE